MFIYLVLQNGGFFMYDFLYGKHHQTARTSAILRRSRVISYLNKHQLAGFSHDSEIQLAPNLPSLGLIFNKFLRNLFPQKHRKCPWHKGEQLLQKALRGINYPPQLLGAPGGIRTHDLRFRKEQLFCL